MYCWAPSHGWKSSWGKAKNTVWAVRREGKARVRNNLWAPRWEKQEKGDEGQQVPEQKFPAAPGEGLSWRTAACGRAHNGAGSSVRRGRREERQRWSVVVWPQPCIPHSSSLLGCHWNYELGTRAWQREVRGTCFTLLPHACVGLEVCSCQVLWGSCTSVL